MVSVTKEFYIANMAIDNIIAFQEQGRMLSGKVAEITENGCTVITKNGSVYYPTKEDIIWVKNGSRWPRGIYNALKLNSK